MICGVANSFPPFRIPAWPTPTPTRPPVRVLIVDDDKAHAETVADVLEPENCDCTVAAGGKAGLAKLAGEPFDVVVTDLKMDGADGLQVLEAAKNELPDAEVIVVTGYGTVSAAVDAMRRDAFTFLSKPIDAAELRRAVAQAAERIRLIRRNAGAEPAAGRAVRVRGRGRQQRGRCGG